MTGHHGTVQRSLTMTAPCSIWIEPNIKRRPRKTSFVDECKRLGEQVKGHPGREDGVDSRRSEGVCHSIC
jgi:hypothetical protein